MKYKVYDLTTNECLSNVENTSIILTPEGNAYYNAYGDYYSIPNSVTIFYPRDNNENWYIDDAGGIHEDGIGWNPNSEPCGECSCISCSICKNWAEKRRN